MGKSLTANCPSQPSGGIDRPVKQQRLPLAIVVGLLIACALAIVSVFRPWGPPVPFLWFFKIVPFTASTSIALGTAIAFGVLATLTVIQFCWPQRVARWIPLALAMVVGLGFIGLVIAQISKHVLAEGFSPDYRVSLLLVQEMGLGPYMMLDASVLAVLVAGFQIVRDLWSSKHEQGKP
jgi:hypothetical protein